jgi:hypothetical protein
MRLVTTIGELSILINQDLAQKEQLIVACFTGKRKTVSEAALELGIPYQTLIRYTRKLTKTGYLVEVGFRENNKRYLTAVKSISDSIAKFDPAIRIHMHGEIMTIADAITKHFANNEVPVRNDLLAGLAALSLRSLERKSGQDSPGGANPVDILFIFKKIQARLGLYFDFVQALIESPIWTDDADNASRVGLPDLSNAEKVVAEFAHRYIRDEKGALER